MSSIRRVLPELTSLALVLGTVTAGLLVAPALPERMIVGWHLGLDGRVSLTRGPRLLGLVAIPAVTVALYVVFRVARFVLDVTEDVDVRLFEILAHLVLGMLALGQGWLLVLNL
ncbi:hypothetical protein [Halorarum halobium]|uniref:hypothetical protein n=1 Tax=Halorarum halobium TaxID=3075121 RepID=UPI0028ABC2B0|nr:hypothetical protein [Halobaculum sp. XH14]